MSIRPLLNLLIPMAGRGTRFRDVGYQTFKPFIPIAGKPMIQHVTDAFPVEVQRHVITSRVLISDDERRYLENDLACHVIDIEPHKQGPAYSIYAARNELPLDEAFFIAYCDIFWTWDFDTIRGSLNHDGIIFTHAGFHPHLVGNNFSAFCLPDESIPHQLAEIREKESFTADWMSEPVSIGAFYIDNGQRMVRAIAHLIANETRVAGEFFPSLLFNHLVAEDARVRLEPVKFYIHWGVPEILDDFEHWRKIMEHESEATGGPQEGAPANVICMGGLGDRMKAVSERPKPLIPIEGRPMFLHVARHFPSKSQTAIVVGSLVSALHDASFEGEVVALRQQTRSQHDTLCEARDHLMGQRDYFLTCCDAYGNVDLQDFREFVSQTDADAVIFSFRPSLMQRKLAGNHTHISVDGRWVRAVHVKSKNSDEDLGLAGLFWIRDGQIFEHIFDAADPGNPRSSVDHIFKFFTDSALKIAWYAIDPYVHLGTPEEYHEFRYWTLHKSVLTTDAHTIPQLARL